MQYLSTAIDAILPSFLIIMLGGIARTVKWISQEDVQHFNRASYGIFAPAIVFNSVYRANLAADYNPALLLFCLVAIFTSWLLSMFLTLRIEKVRTRRGVLQLSMYFSNIMLLGMPMMIRVYGEGSTGKMGIAISVIVPAYNVLASITSEIFRGEQVKVKKILLGIMTNPLIIGSVLGILFNKLNICLPNAVDSVVSSMAGAATVLMLFLLGCYFRFDGLEGIGRNVLISAMVRLVIFPLGIISVALMLGFRNQELLVLLITFAAPSGSSIFSMANRLQGDLQMASSVILVSTLLSSITLSLWLTVLMWIRAL